MRDKIQRKSILLLLGVTKAVASTNKTVPGRWTEFINSIRVTSQTAHLKLIQIDEKAALEFYDMEKDFKRRIGRGKLYTKSDIEDARHRIEKVDF
ncbi:hypothetical protein [Candidatus Nanohalobium constans]|uniref:Uncharacterized protein n=1 Tax=Candidatus Nanohalobium constans TaxID=2565781 RepID=A0A5Q0UFX8_9ARCH|nr:hypothetical protein [Candidatus Nanohalobium constans]QGA80542.1 hypothetical protein LC1Nh_0651 [Candidatus Nanohalobium constans]